MKAHTLSEMQKSITAIMDDRSFNRNQAAVRTGTFVDPLAERSTAIVAASGEFYEELKPSQQRHLRATWHIRRKHPS